MSRDNLQDSTRYLVKNEHVGSIIPGNRSEMLRDVFIEPGAKVHGGIYGNEIYINGNDIIIKGSVYCKSNIQFKSLNDNNDNDVVFQSVVVCNGTILVPPNNSKIRFLSDIYSGKINLKNCIVYGNIYASSATLENTIVLGGIYCNNDLKLKNSIIFTFRANHCIIDNFLSMLSPFGFSDKISIESTVNVLTFKNLFKHNNSIDNSGKLILDKTDIYEVELEKKDELDINSVKKIQVLSVAERLLNTFEIIDHFKQNKKFIEFLSLNSHLCKEDKMSFTKNKKDELEAELWKIIDEKSVFDDLIGAKSINEMFNEFK